MNWSLQGRKGRLAAYLLANQMPPCQALHLLQAVHMMQHLFFFNTCPETAKAACRDRVFAEIRVLKQLKHKNIMTFYDSWLDQKTYSVNFITEMFTSGTLRQYVNLLSLSASVWQSQHCRTVTADSDSMSLCSAYCSSTAVTASFGYHCRAKLTLQALQVSQAPQAH